MAKAATKGKSPAMAVGALIDKLYDLQKAREAKQSEFDAIIKKMKAEEDEIEQHFIDSFTADEISKMAGSRASASLDSEVFPQIDGDDPKAWDKLRKHIVKTGEWDLLEKRIGKTAFRERYKAKVAVPGVKAFVKKTLHVRKIGK
jgi:hypothetical protein